MSNAEEIMLVSDDMLVKMFEEFMLEWVVAHFEMLIDTEVDMNCPQCFGLIAGPHECRLDFGNGHGFYPCHLNTYWQWAKRETIEYLGNRRIARIMCRKAMQALLDQTNFANRPINRIRYYTSLERLHGLLLSNMFWEGVFAEMYLSATSVRELMQEPVSDDSGVESNCSTDNEE